MIVEKFVKNSIWVALLIYIGVVFIFPDNRALEDAIHRLFTVTILINAFFIDREEDAIYNHTISRILICILLVFFIATAIFAPYNQQLNKISAITLFTVILTMLIIYYIRKYLIKRT